MQCGAGNRHLTIYRERTAIRRAWVDSSGPFSEAHRDELMKVAMVALPLLRLRLNEEQIAVHPDGEFAFATSEAGDFLKIQFRDSE